MLIFFMPDRMINDLGGVRGSISEGIVGTKAGMVRLEINGKPRRSVQLVKASHERERGYSSKSTAAETRRTDRLVDSVQKRSPVQDRMALGTYA